LSSLPGAAITSIQVEGVLHEFSTIPGVFEDTTDIILNLKAIRLKVSGNAGTPEEPLVLRLRVEKEGTVYARDFDHGPEIEILTPDQPVATVDAGGRLQPLTPEQVRTLEREDRPLVAFNTNHYTARDSDNLSNGQKRFYNVTGLVRNQSSRLLHDVEVEVRFYNAQHATMDVQMVAVGSMGPDEVRAFRAEASNYDDLYNITDFEVIPRWGR
jgi:hypothetical protein